MNKIVIETKWNKQMKNGKWTGNYIGDKGAKMISEALMKNTALTTLGLGSDR